MKRSEMITEIEKEILNGLGTNGLTPREIAEMIFVRVTEIQESNNG